MKKNHNYLKKYLLCVVTLLLIFYSNTTFGDTLHVPSPEYGTIQEAIDAASNGDTVLVYYGIYMEDIYFKGKSITVRSDGDGNPETYDISPHATIISAEQMVVTFWSGEAEEAVIDGFPEVTLKFI